MIFTATGGKLWRTTLFFQEKSYYLEVIYYIFVKCLTCLSPFYPMASLLGYSCLELQPSKRRVCLWAFFFVSLKTLIFGWGIEWYKLRVFLIEFQFFMLIYLLHFRLVLWFLWYFLSIKCCMVSCNLDFICFINGWEEAFCWSSHFKNIGCT